MKKINIYFHGRCFDGVLSASFFTMFYKDRFENVEFSYYPMIHKPGFNFDSLMQGENIENIVLDLPYPGSEKVSWWFDHHQSSFKSNEIRKEYEKNNNNKNLYWDPKAYSNTNFMVKILQNKFDFKIPQNQQKMLEWADIIDGARFDSSDIPSELMETAPAFAALLEYDDTPDLEQKLIEEISDGKNCEDLSKEVFWSRKLNKIRQKNWDMIEDVKKLISVTNEVAFIDLRSLSVSGYNKFIPYYLKPQIHYAVTLLELPQKVKISVSANPWSDFARSSEGADIGSLCERYGGGGHYSVGAVSFKPDTDENKINDTVSEILKVLSDNVIKKHDSVKSSLLDQGKLE